MSDTGNSSATTWHGTTIVTVRKGDMVVTTDTGGTFDHHMGSDYRTRTDLNTRTDN